jgi:hypothetical protein
MREKVQVLQRLQDDFHQARDVFAKCGHCNDESRYPVECNFCGVMGEPSELPRAVRVLWSTGETPPSQPNIT